MKYLVSATPLLVCIQCTVSSLLMHPSATALQLTDLTRQANRLTKRQTTSISSSLDLLGCVATGVDSFCPSGYYQQVVDIALGCRNNDIAASIAEFCKRIENGDFCVPALFNFVSQDIEALSASTAACIGAVSSGTCPSNCHSLLEMARSKLGCCVNANFTKLYITINESVWNICNVPQPDSDCVDGLLLNPPQNSQTCTPQELLERVADYTCTPSVGQPLVDALQQNSKCNTMARQYVDGCSSNANGQTCFALAQANLLPSTGQAAGNDPLYTSLIQSCPSTPSGNSGEYQCDSSCRSAVNNFASSYGCCVNAANASLNGVPQLSYSLWSSCGVETPGDCGSSTLSFSGSATVFAQSWMIAILVAIYVALYM